MAKNESKYHNILVDMHKVASCVMLKEQSTVGGLERQQHLNNKEIILFIHTHANNQARIQRERLGGGAISVIITSQGS